LAKTAKSEQLTANEAAERLGLSPQQIRTIIRQGKLPATKHGRDWVIDSNDLQLIAKRPGRGRPRKKAVKEIDDEE